MGFLDLILGRRKRVDVCLLDPFAVANANPKFAPTV